MLNIGGWELMIILLVALVVLGPERLPSVARQLGQTVSSLRSMASSFQAEVEAATKAATPNMTLDGPTSKADAIAATQDAATGAAMAAAGADAIDGLTESESGVSDPFDMAAKARRAQQEHRDRDKPVSEGGPSDLRDSDSGDATSDDTNSDETNSDDGDEEE